MQMPGLDKTTGRLEWFGEKLSRSFDRRLNGVIGLMN